MVACFRCLLVNEQPHGLPRPVDHAVLIFSPGLIPVKRRANLRDRRPKRVTEAAFRLSRASGIRRGFLPTRRRGFSTSRRNFRHGFDPQLATHRAAPVRTERGN